ncbi:MAG: SDR family oxidoreductase [Leptospiraceae bacterium]|nr:SDR family oxidoreductase [Leptospiraceae bacterium]
MSIVEYIKPKGENGFGYGSTALEVTEGIDLKGKTFLVTGCNSGLGKETARVLALRGGKVIGTARTSEKAKEAIQEIGGFAGYACELSEPSSIRSCIAEIVKDKHTLDAIICNAGIMALPNLEKKFGYELQFITNHIGHFILVNGLLGQLSEYGRVILVSSTAHTAAPISGIDFDNLDGSKGYRPWTFYGQSKFANLLFAKELARRFSGTKKTAFALHPGVIKTNLSRHMGGVVNFLFGTLGALFLKTIPQGAATQTYLATAPNVESKSGYYYADCNPAFSRPDADNASLAKKLWEVSESIVEKL